MRLYAWAALMLLVFFLNCIHCTSIPMATIVEKFVNKGANLGEVVEFRARVLKHHLKDTVAITWLPLLPNCSELFLWDEEWPKEIPLGGPKNPHNVQKFISISKVQVDIENMLNEYVVTVTIPSKMEEARVFAAEYKLVVSVYKGNREIHTQASLVVLDHPICNVLAISERETDDIVPISCSVPFYGYRSPQIKWTDASGYTQVANKVVQTQAPGSNVTTLSRTIEVSQRELTGHQQYYCEVYFKFGANDVDAVKGEPPTYSQHCATKFSSATKFSLKDLEQWKKWNVLEWAMHMNLTSVNQHFSSFLHQLDGPLLKLLIGMRQTSPRYFYTHLSHSYNLDLQDMLQLETAIIQLTQMHE